MEEAQDFSFRQANNEMRPLTEAQDLEHQIVIDSDYDFFRDEDVAGLRESVRSKESDKNGIEVQGDGRDI